jgi:hypothetical protein
MTVGRFALPHRSLLVPVEIFSILDYLAILS